MALRRVLAYVADAVLLARPLAAMHIAGALLGFLTFGLVSRRVALALSILSVAYDALLIGGPRSATLGMRLLDVELRTLDGGRPGHGLAALWSRMYEPSVLLTGRLILARPPQRSATHPPRRFSGVVMVRRGAGRRENG